MASRRVAAVTRALLMDLAEATRLPPMTKEKAGDAQVVRLARAEVLALVAVARAARTTANEWNRWDEARPETCARMYRALARLDALSKGRDGR